MTGEVLLTFILLWPFVSALITFTIGKFNKRYRDYFSMAASLMEICLSVYMLLNFNDISVFIPNILGEGIGFTFSKFRGIYTIIASFMWFITFLISREYFHHYRLRNRYHMFTLLTLGAVVGVLLSADFFTCFVFFEIMSFTSFVMVINNELPDSLDAAGVYMAVAVISGLVMLMGILMVLNRAGTVNYYELSLIYTKNILDKTDLLIPCILMLVGFGAKAGSFPLHIWLPTAHPAAPAPASALLSGMLTKAGIFGILVITANLLYHYEIWGNIIFVLGVCTMFLGAVMALFSINIKRILACSSISQIGFILIGIGISALLKDENSIAISGTVLHMVNHSLIKLALFLSVGAIYMNTHELNINKLKGYGKRKWAILTSFTAGGLCIMGIPGFSGYYSKTLIHEAIVEYIHELAHLGSSTAIYSVCEWLFLLSGGITVAYILKIFIALFIETSKEEIEIKHGNGKLELKAHLALYISALVLLVASFTPHIIYDNIAKTALIFMNNTHEFHAVTYFSFENLKGSFISIGFGGIIYYFVVRNLTIKDGEYLDLWPKSLNLEKYVYRPLFMDILPNTGHIVVMFISSPIKYFKPVVRKFIPSLLLYIARGFYDIAGLIYIVFVEFIPLAGRIAGNRVNDYLESRLGAYEVKEELEYVEVGDKPIAYVDLPHDEWFSAFVKIIRNGFANRPIVIDNVRLNPQEEKEFKEIKSKIESGISFSLLFFSIGIIAAVIFIFVL